MMRRFPRAASAAASLLLLNLAVPIPGVAYGFNYLVADLRQPASTSGGTACPQPMRFDVSVAGGINRQWSTSLDTNPVTILTVDQTPDGRLSEIENTITQSFATWTGVSGSALVPASLASLTRTSLQDACAADGQNTICFNQSDPAFTTGVLAFTRVVSADRIGEQVTSASPPSTFIGQILDADILLRPTDSTVTFATPQALAGNPSAYDLESVLTHEMGHLFGLAHSGVWRAMMFPFVPSPGTYLGIRPTAQVPDAPLAEDDRTGLRSLYPDPSDTTHIGSISGRILPSNGLALSGEPTGTTGIFAAEVVAVDSATGTVEGAALSGWTCSDPGPPLFDGSYRIDHLAVGTTRTYLLYVEPLDGPLNASDALEMSTLCRNAFTDSGWPSQFACTTPTPITNFSTRIRPSP